MADKLNRIQRLEQVNSRLKNENAKLREDNKQLKKEVKHLKQELENVLLRLDELTNIVFGKKKKKKKYSFDDDDKPSVPRSSSSYQRDMPDESEVTDYEYYQIDICPDCGIGLTKKQIVVRLIEDISIPVLEALEKDKSDIKVKRVIKQEIEKGYCPRCRKWHSKIPINNKAVILGLGVKQLTAYLINVLRLTYSQTKNVFWDLYRLRVSEGEITNILNKISILLRPEFERLKLRILQAKSVHLDETGNQTGKEKNYSWVLASGETQEAVFEIGRSRGKGNAEELLNNNSYLGVRITDCFGAYKKLTGEHQVCWVHVLRKAKDLSVNSNLTEDKKQFAYLIHQDLKDTYLNVKTILQTKFNLNHRQKELPKLKTRLNLIINRIQKYPNPPQKLADLAGQLTRYINQLFTCIVHPGVAPENNKAERKIRHLVLKRKNSFGTKTKKGNRILSTNLSVLMSLWWQDRNEFFPEFSRLLVR